MRGRARSSWRLPSSSTTWATATRAIRLSEPFMRKVVADMDNDWTLTDAEVDAAIRAIED